MSSFKLLIRIVLIAKRGTVSGTGNVQDLDVVQATSEQDVITAFGEDSQVHRGYYELLAGGAERVFIVLSIIAPEQ